MIDETTPEQRAMHQVKVLERRIAELERQIYVERRAAELAGQRVSEVLDERDRLRERVRALGGDQ